ncbi:MAG: chromosome segregation protein SMC [Phycisphaerae bacterium]|nr:chromosome segregation protein SMC [Phycisphaerae bacterium]
MKLKKLILSGFKSFADKTEFEFDEGITGIVGPNGCGKSNVVDAIKWVLGEQSAKSLRGSEMMDVIFNGSSARKPAGGAYVTLVFDNHEGVLKIPVGGGQEDEVTPTVSITRRLFRSGQSDYLINKTPCRLRDIKEIFMDTGLGTNAYSIIEQGQVSQFLQASKEERRAFFDEAAGISRYKARKKETMRKLDRVEQNLLRVQDILAEVQKRLRSIKYQAGKARNYQAYSQQLKELRSMHFLSQYHRMKLKRKDEQTGLDVGSDKVAAANTMISQLEKSQQATEIESVQLEQTARDVQSKVTTISAQITTLRERAEMQSRRIEELSQQILVNASRGEELEAKIEDCAKDIATREIEIQQVLQSGEQLQRSAEALREEVAAAELARTEIQSQIDDEKAGINDLLRRVGHLHNEVHNIGIKRVGLNNEHDRLSTRLEQLSQQLKETMLGHAQVNAKRQATEELITESKSKLDDVRSKVEFAADSEQKLTRELSGARETRSSLQGRMHTLEEMQLRLEGVAEGTKRVLEATREGKHTTIRGMLGDFIETNVEHAPVVEAALAGADQRLIATLFDEVQRNSEQLEETLGEGGSVEIICLDRMQEVQNDDVAVAPPHSVGRVLDMVRFESWLEPTMWNLLGHTLVVRTLADAALAAEVTPRGYRFVTLGGEVLEPDGRVRMGAAGLTAGVIARKSELTELQYKLDSLEEQIESLSNQCKQTHEQREHLEEVLQSLRTALHEATFEKTECDKRASALEDQITKQRNEEPQLNENLQKTQDEIDAIIQREQDTKQKTSQLEQSKTERNEKIESLEKKLTELTESQQHLNEKRTGIKVAIAETEQKKLGLNESIGSLKQLKETMNRDLESARKSIDLDRQRKVTAQDEIEKSKSQITELTADQQKYQVELEEVQESRHGLSEKLTEIRHQLTDRRKQAEIAVEEVSNLRVKLSELDAHIGDTITRASEEMQMDVMQLYETYEHDEQRDWDEVEREINELRGKISRLGNVNLDSISEQEELEQREGFLDGQLADIADSQKQLEELIAKLNKESRVRFEETFHSIRENFQTLFRKLFGGGKADLVLSDPEDILESGIEIIARPPGKEPRSISLLSGGEQTMSALALMFSFYYARPSPFCFLDEVDAALDEANNERYNAIVKEFAEHSQFIMITHSKRTMSIADTLYGVTQQQLGVSNRISVKFEEASNLVDEKQLAAS